MDPNALGGDQTWTACLHVIDSWPVEHAAAAVLNGGDVVETYGPIDRAFRLASITKLLTALVVLLADEEGSVDLDEPAGPPGSTVRHLLAHASGLGPQGEVLAPPATRRIYSNAGYEVLADVVASHTGMPFNEYARQGVLEPLGLHGTEMTDSAAHGAASTIADLVKVASEFVSPQILAPETVRSAANPAFPDLAGVLPGFGSHAPNPWGLGPEVRGNKQPHWTGSLNSSATFGHFGQAGTMLWIDPVADLSLIALTDRDFGAWSTDAWPSLSDLVLGQRTGAERLILGDPPDKA